MALNLNHIEVNLNQPFTALIETSEGIVIRSWVPFMGWYFTKANEDYNPEGFNQHLNRYLPDRPASPSSLLKLIDIIE